MKHLPLILASGAWSLALATLSCSSSSTTEAGPAPSPNTACTGVSFPKVPADSSSIVYVAKSCPTEGADGTADHPYNSIQQGLNKSDKGGAVMVAPGTYDESVSVHQGAAIYGSDGDSSDTARVTIQSSSPYGVTVDSGDGDVILQGLKVIKPIGAGIWVVSGKASVLASQVLGSQPTSEHQFGFGILATGGQLTVAKSVVDGSTQIGVVVQNAAVAISDSRVSNNGAGGVRLEMPLGNAQLLNNTIEDNILSGITILSGQVTIEGNTISGTNPPGTVSHDIDYSAIGDGIVVGSIKGAVGVSRVQIHHNKITNCSRLGLFLTDSAEGEVTENEVTDNALTTFGAGIWLQGGVGTETPIKISGNTIARNRGAGLVLTDLARADVSDNKEISETILTQVFVGTETGMIGDGVSIFLGATAKVQNNIIRKNGRAGLIADQASGMSLVDGNQITDNLDSGIVVQNDTTKASFLGTNTFSNNQKMDQHILAPSEKPYFINPGPFKEH